MFSSKRKLLQFWESTLFPRTGVWYVQEDCLHVPDDKYWPSAIGLLTLETSPESRWSNCPQHWQSFNTTTEKWIVWRVFSTCHSNILIQSTQAVWSFAILAPIAVSTTYFEVSPTRPGNHWPIIWDKHHLHQGLEVCAKQELNRSISEIAVQRVFQFPILQNTNPFSN